MCMHAAIQTTAMKRMELKSSRPLKVSSVDGSADRTSAVNWATEVRRRDSETILAVSRQGINGRLTQVCGNTFAPIPYQRTVSRPIWSFAGTHGHITVLVLYPVYTITGCQTGCTTGCQQPVVKPVWQPIDNRLYCIRARVQPTLDPYAESRGIVTVPTHPVKWQFQHTR